MNWTRSRTKATEIFWTVDRPTARLACKQGGLHTRAHTRTQREERVTASSASRSPRRFGNKAIQDSSDEPELFLRPSQWTKRHGGRFSLSTTVYLTHLSLKKLRRLSPRANYTDRAPAACRRSQLRIEGATWSA
jgi:hypothetical protein